jgi:hypothetical protein
VLVLVLSRILVASQGVGLLSTLQISPEQLAEYWEAFSLNKSVSELTDHTFHAYRAAVMKEAEGAVVARPALGKRQAAPMVTPVKRPHTPSNANRVTMSPNKVTPHPPTPTPTPHLPSYGKRKNAGQVIVTFNPNDLPAITPIESSSRRCEVSASFPTNVKKPYRHMFTTLEERSNALDRHLVKMGEEMIERYEIGKDDGIAALEAVGVPRQDTVCCIGRVCNEVRMQNQYVHCKSGCFSHMPTLIFHRHMKDESIRHLSCWKDRGTHRVENESM